jgi:hypothetical protein
LKFAERKVLVLIEQILDCTECKELMLSKQKLDSTEKKELRLNKQNFVLQGAKCNS